MSWLIKSSILNPISVNLITLGGKGTFENINVLIRRFFPKGTDFYTITEEKIKCVQDWINSRPMKVLDYKTPAEAYLYECVPLAC